MCWKATPRLQWWPCPKINACVGPVFPSFTVSRSLFKTCTSSCLFGPSGPKWLCVSPRKRWWSSFAWWYTTRSSASIGTWFAKRCRSIAFWWKCANGLMLRHCIVLVQCATTRQYWRLTERLLIHDSVYQWYSWGQVWQTCAYQGLWTDDSSLLLLTAYICNTCKTRTFLCHC